LLSFVFFLWILHTSTSFCFCVFLFLFSWVFFLGGEWDFPSSTCFF
jgi:hypothetical protein